MATVRTNIAQKGQEWLQDVERQVEAAVYRALVKTGLIGESRVKGAIQKEAYDTGRFLRSVTWQIVKGNDDLRLILGSNLDYSIDIELGRKAGKWPNLNAMVKWVGRKMREKGINARVNVSFEQLKAMARGDKKRKKPTAQQKVARQQLSMLYLVGRKIATKGIREKMIFKRIEDGLLSYFRAEVQKELNLIR